MEQRLVLNSWKEIADYMGRGVRTVQRYERDLRLPVHRPAGKSRSAVIAFADEIDHWMRKGPARAVASGNGVKHVSPDLRQWERLMTNTELLLNRAEALKTQMGHISRLMEETVRRRKLMLDRSGSEKFSKGLIEVTEKLQTKMTELSKSISRNGT